ncbi:MAG: beta-galactosidase [Armatimonadetes bacterium]|nr:beta-galactosidase [Armatimonadota bacterium]
MQQTPLSDSYTTILWVGGSEAKNPEKFPLFVQRLKEMGINTGMVTGDEDPMRWVKAGMPYYVENIVNRGLCLKFSSQVTDWDKFVTQWVKDGRPEAAFVRDYCLDDPAWRQDAKKKMQAAVGVHKANQPALYDIRDELSVTISANPFDYDFSPRSLAGFRTWLQTQYADLAALNTQWQTELASWGAVVPFSTDKIKNRMGGGGANPRGKPDWGEVQALKFDLATASKDPTRWNFSPWCDFRTYMDVALTRTLSELRDAAKASDPNAKVGIEGTQMPSAFGGYDLARLATALDWVEPYDIGNAREIFGSFMPGKPMLTTVGEQDARSAQRRLWHLLLMGDTGCIIWWSEDCLDFSKDDWPLTKRAQALAPVLKELQGPTATRFRKAKRESDPIYIHYSQPSVQVAWLLESTVDGSTWHRRFSSYEAEHNQHAKVRAAWLGALHDLGYTPQFTADLASLPANATVILPHSYALTPIERRTLMRFKIVLASGPVGVFDGHGKLTDGYTGATKVFPQPPTAEELARLLPPPSVRVRPSDHVRVHRYVSGNERLLAFERGVRYQMSESLQQASGNEALEKPIEVVAVLDKPALVAELATGKSLGRTATLRFTLDPWHPQLFSLR